MSDAATTAAHPPFPTAFVVVTFTVAIAVGALVTYLGIRGMIGAGIP
ncbi:MAG TPA: hypothetical protein VMG36_01200 [Thermoplasmata archaeon]|nr:hypothetical protein [Thermoplasmata archaeon]